MPIATRMLDMVVRIAALGDFVGTGFLVSVASEADPQHSWPYVVTAHHNVRSQIEITAQARDPASGGLYPPVPIAAWSQPLPGADLAVAPWPDRPDHRYMATPLETRVLPIPDFAEMPQVGSRIFYIGIFEPLDRPVARAGNVAALDQTGIPHSKAPTTFLPISWTAARTTGSAARRAFSRYRAPASCKYPRRPRSRPR